MTTQKIHEIGDWSDIDTFITGTIRYIHQHERERTIGERRKFIALLNAIEEYTGDDLSCYQEMA